MVRLRGVPIFICCLVLLACVEIESISLKSIDILQEIQRNYSEDEVWSHLVEFQKIADTIGNGNRAAGTLGFNASSDYAQGYLSSSTNLTITIQHFPFYNYTELSTPILQMQTPSSLDYKYDVDFTALRNSNSGDLQAAIQSAGKCCNSEEFGSFVEGRIALCSHAEDECSLDSQIVLSQSFGAVAVFVINLPDEGPYVGGLTNPSEGIVFGLRYQIGQEIIQMLNDSPSSPPTFYCSAEISLIQLFSSNLIVDTPPTYVASNNQDQNIIVFGAHLDSVEDGPGMNDNAASCSALLYAASYFSNFIEHNKIQNRVRFIWFGAEEEGKVGSNFYVNNLKTSGDLPQIAAYYNFDMIASPNFYRGVFNGSTSGGGLEGPSTKLQSVLEDYFLFNNLTYRLISFGGGPDYAPFLANGIPAGGLHTGTDIIKLPFFRTMFGGIALARYDPCYHSPCDTLENLSTVVLHQNTQSALYAVLELSQKEDLQSFLNSQSPHSALQHLSPTEQHLHLIF